MHKAIGSQPEKIDKPAIISLEMFKKNDDGSWKCIKTTDIKTPDGIHRVNAGMVFNKNKIQWGLDVCGLLEELEANL